MKIGFWYCQWELGFNVANKNWVLNSANVSWAFDIANENWAFDVANENWVLINKSPLFQTMDFDYRFEFYW